MKIPQTGFALPLGYPNIDIQKSQQPYNPSAYGHSECLRLAFESFLLEVSLLTLEGHGRSHFDPSVVIIHSNNILKFLFQFFVIWSSSYIVESANVAVEIFFIDDS